MKSRSFLLSLACMALAGGAQAAVVTLTGSQFDVRYDTANVGLFGTPSLAGNVVFFTPTNFAVQSVNGNGPASLSSTLTIEFIAHTGLSFASIGIGETGDYLMLGASSSVGVSGTVTAFDALAGMGAGVSTTALALDPTLPLTIVDGTSHNWVASGSIDGSLPSAGWLGSAGTVSFSLANTLTASTSLGAGPQQAFIEKKFAGVALSVNMIPPGQVNGVPAPGSLALAGIALLALGVLRRSSRGG